MSSLSPHYDALVGTVVLGQEPCDRWQLSTAPALVRCTAVVCLFGSSMCVMLTSCVSRASTVREPESKAVIERLSAHGSISACLLAACKAGLCAMAVCKQPTLVPACAGERPSDGKSGGGLRGALRGLALGAAAAAAVLVAARAVLRARSVQDEAPGERMQRELRDLQRRIEVLPASCLAPLEASTFVCVGRRGDPWSYMLPHSGHAMSVKL